MNHWPRIQSPACSPYPNCALPCKSKPLGTLYSHALLILTKNHPKSKNQMVHEQKFKGLLSSKCPVRMGEHAGLWILGQWFNTHWGNILLLFFFCFHVVKTLKSIMALLPTLFNYEKTWVYFVVNGLQVSRVYYSSELPHRLIKIIWDRSTLIYNQLGTNVPFHIYHPQTKLPQGNVFIGVTWVGVCLPTIPRGRQTPLPSQEADPTGQESDLPGIWWTSTLYESYWNSSLSMGTFQTNI